MPKIAVSVALCAMMIGCSTRSPIDYSPPAENLAIMPLVLAKDYHGVWWQALEWTGDLPNLSLPEPPAEPNLFPGCGLTVSELKLRLVARMRPPAKYRPVEDVVRANGGLAYVGEPIWLDVSRDVELDIPFYYY